MEEKPRRASLPEGSYFETIDLKEALKALELPRDLGKMKNGDRVVVLIGRYGPYLKVGNNNVTLPKDYDPYTVQLSDVETVIKESIEQKKKMQEAILEFPEDPVSKQPIKLKVGRYGPYISDGKTNASLPKGQEPKDVTFEMAVELLEKKRKAPKRKWGGKK